MPTKHIDDGTAAELDELYVRCVTLTQQPVKEVEVLRLAIQKGINNIADDDILASMTVKSTVWKGLADNVWNEVTSLWPQNAISAENFDVVAQAHSQTWQNCPSETCRKALYAQLIQMRFELQDPMFTTDSELFPTYDFGMSPEEEQAARDERKRLNAEYIASLPDLNGRLYSSLSSRELTLAHHYTKSVSYEPDGNGDFRVLVNADN